MTGQVAAVEGTSHVLLLSAGGGGALLKQAPVFKEGWRADQLHGLQQEQRLLFAGGGGAWFQHLGQFLHFLIPAAHKAISMGRFP